MKILFVTPRLPYPPLKGDQIVPYYRLKHLSRDHAITLLSFYENDAELELIEHLRPYCEAIHLVKLPRWRAWLNVVGLGLISTLPLQVAYYHSRHLRARLNELVSTGGFDRVHGFLLRSAPHLEATGVPTLLELIDSMQLNLTRRLAGERGWRCWAVAEELKRVKRYENGLKERFAYMTVVSALDRECIDASRIEAIPLGVDREAFFPADGPAQAPVITFSGNMAYAPNVLAIRWFVDHCFPLLQAIEPAVRLQIAGVNPGPAVRDLALLPGVEVMGYVPSMPEVLRGSRLAIAPMRSGSGMQFKILEAMACGLPVVATSLGLGNIQARDGIELAIADEPAAFARAIAALLQDAPRAREMGLRAQAFVAEHHSWEQAARRIDAIYHLMAVSGEPSSARDGAPR